MLYPLSGAISRGAKEERHLAALSFEPAGSGSRNGAGNGKYRERAIYSTIRRPEHFRAVLFLRAGKGSAVS